MFKKSLFILLCLIALSNSNACLGLAEQPELKRIAGEVADVDWVAGKLVVRTMDFTNVDEITVMVTQDTRITKGTDTIGLAGVNVTDQVEVKYYSSLAGLRAANITVVE